MRLRSGARLGPYEIVAPIGAGGMGEVFKARDTRLERIVAIKILPEALAGDDIKRSRLQREARVISQLNHPHICMLHDTGSEDGIDFLVMEHLEGHSLADRLTRGALPLDQVLRIGIEIAEALHRAHQQQIVHRDLKPSNIMLTKSGSKLLDFGLAKFVDGADASVTAEGTVVGTPRYMAPEEMEGHGSDHRADIFALGCVLYEMRTGKPAVGGVQRAAPPALDNVIARCLERDPERRWQNAWDIAEQLRWIRKVAARRRSQWKRSAWMAMTVALLIAIVAALFPLLRSRTPQPQVRATFTRLTDAAGVEGGPAISPDGKLVAYQSRTGGDTDIHLLRIGGRNAMNLTADSKADDHMPAFSPDGQWIAFRSERAGGGIFVMGATGESVRRVSDFGFNPAWSPNGKEVVVSTNGSYDSDGPYTIGPGRDLWRIEIASGRKRRVFEGDAYRPTWSPDGDRIAFFASHRGDILSIPSNGGPPTQITSGTPRDWGPVWSSDGYIYFSSNRGGSMNLWRIAVDEATGTSRGEPEPLTSPALWSGPLGISADGKRIIYCARDPQSDLQRLSFDPARELVIGAAAQIPLGNRHIAMPDVSPDGQWIVFNTLFDQEDVYVMRSDGSNLRKLTDDLHTDTQPRWSPDGKRIAFSSSRTGIASKDTGNSPPRAGIPFQLWAINADGSALTQLTAFDGGAGGPSVWSPDGRLLALRGGANCKGPCLIDLTATLPARTGEPLPPREDYRGPLRDWSPDGRWIAGTAFRRDDVTDHRAFVYSVDTRAYSVLPQRLSGSGMEVRWMSDSRRILLLDNGKLYVVDRKTSRAREIHAFDFLAIAFALSNDDRTIYVIAASDEADVWLATLQ